MDVSTWYGYRSPDVDIEGARWTVAEVLATDWEVKREPRTWTGILHGIDEVVCVDRLELQVDRRRCCKHGMEGVRVRIVEEL